MRATVSSLRTAPVSRRANLLQEPVARQVAQAVVDVLEPSRSMNSTASWEPSRSARAQRVPQPVVEEQPVGQVGQRVVVRQWVSWPATA